MCDLICDVINASDKIMFENHKKENMETIFT